ncbi:hypothetical protein ACHAQH_003031 [Verticillium albo-atrum]
MKTLEECFCPNIALQSALSDCAQLSCHYEDQVMAVGVESALCAAYPKPSRSNEVKTIAMVFTIVTFPIVGLRFLSRWTATSTFWWDDWTVLAAIVCLAGLAGIEIASAELGFGMHYWHVKPENATALLQLFYAVQMLYILIQVFAKMSILLFFSRIFQVRWFLITVRAFIAFLIVHGLLFVLLVAFQCMPVSSVWDRSNNDRTCINMTAVGYAGAAFSIIEDLVIMALPVPELLKLQLTRKKKIALAIIFALGSFACVTSLIRLKYLVMFMGTLDTTWDNVDIVIWSVIESFCCILCASILALPPLVLKLSKFVRHQWSQMSTRVTSSTNNKSRQSTLSIPGSKGFEKMSRSPEDGGYPMAPLSPQGNDKRLGNISISRDSDSRRDIESLSIERRV